MRISSLPVFLLPTLAASRICHSQPQPASSPSTATIPSPTATSISNSGIPAPEPTSTPAVAENLDLREIVADPNAVQPTSQPLATAAAVEQLSLTVQWVETVVNGVKTWVPVTATFKFEAVPSQAPGPGKGIVGMGTLTGVVGVTKTVKEGAAPTTGPGWKGIGAALGMGLAGLVV
ncbi:uncharacterized protein BDR25DRAFT_315752 [Lindgomyces ingoldianus]|uniref:Uncharacterized protein n=1 Tax=Lindgomyces ingoldianus TaxID=673940 RepID=A0ACB6QP67_9PLEO|nr:uncharacterized protein BDR25DRAFT_315752 [Lindgomyces ingoldianus]KAF2468774.1 hypothetical protein BDR25DRAFT_315752 [Lindgomyces ingoldianus]